MAHFETGGLAWPTATVSPWRLSVAPMMDWTDRHCRFFHRLITQKTRLYTEMVTTGALLNGDVARHLAHDAAEHPLALQLGGSETEDLAHCARLAEQWGFAEINLNCGCPSERVQRGAFGACLMNEATLVRDCVKAMADACALPITVKHRIGIDHTEDTPQSYPFVRDFVGTVADGGCSVFIVHARNAWLSGLSPRENRERPPLRYELVHRLKADFPHLTICINGGIESANQIAEQLRHTDGVMVGRDAYHNPWHMRTWDAQFWPTRQENGLADCDDLAGRDDVADRVAIESAMVAYCERVRQAELAQPKSVSAHKHPFHWHHAMRHTLGLYNGLPGARHWRRVWSDHHLRHLSASEAMQVAFEAREKARLAVDSSSIHQQDAYT